MPKNIFKKLTTHSLFSRLWTTNTTAAITQSGDHRTTGVDFTRVFFI